MEVTCSRLRSEVGLRLVEELRSPGTQSSTVPVVPHSPLPEGSFQSRRLWIEVSQAWGHCCP